MSTEFALRERQLYNRSRTIDNKLLALTYTQQFYPTLNIYSKDFYIRCGGLMNHDMNQLTVMEG